jgi:transposase
MKFNTGREAQPLGPVWLDEEKSFYYWQKVYQSLMWPERWASAVGLSTNGLKDLLNIVWGGYRIKKAEVEKRSFPPEVAIYLVKIACERPDNYGRSLSHWDCAELSRELIRSGIVSSISAETVRRILQSHHLKPWRFHMWLSSQVPRDESFFRQVQEIIDLYTRPLSVDEMVLCVDEKTSLQPRCRTQPTRPSMPGYPNLVEHEYKRDGALNLFAGFDTRTGHIYGKSYERKRQEEFIDYLEYLDSQIPGTIKTIHLVCDNLKTHKGTKVKKWLMGHSRFVFHYTPVHCSWMNQIEQWFSILQRKRFRISDFQSKDDLKAKIEGFISEWNQVAHPFNWSTQSGVKIMDKMKVAA